MVAHTNTFFGSSLIAEMTLLCYAVMHGDYQKVLRGMRGPVLDGVNSGSESIESNHCHRAASGINIQRLTCVEDHPRSRSWINGQDGRDGRDGSLLPSLSGFFRDGRDGDGCDGRDGPQGCHLYRPDHPIHADSSRSKPTHLPISSDPTRTLLDSENAQRNHGSTVRKMCETTLLYSYGISLIHVSTRA